jgi:predicted RNA-binding Zn-ribbon protein involved in translation (DUF1610 family)
VIRQGGLAPRVFVQRIDAFARFTVRCPACGHVQVWRPRTLLHRSA